MKDKRNLSSPTLHEQGDEKPLVCPICNHEVIPENASESDDQDAIRLCEHAVLQHLWGGHDPDETTPEISAWWDSMETRRVELDDDCDAPETIYRECPYIDHLVEHTMCSPLKDFTASFGFRKIKL